MKIVIDIPDRIQYGIEKGITANGSAASRIVLEAVKNGKPYEERKTGRWIRRHSKMWECSECERGCRWRENYCPDCGAKMEVNE